MINGEAQRFSIFLSKPELSARFVAMSRSNNGFPKGTVSPLVGVKGQRPIVAARKRRNTYFARRRA
ncbi:MAG: hypothetical protein IJ035_02770, partial [Oscillospiraceae bacterium]|nr:hypothetical protein [Oscillospiraceae bacterium]